MEEKSQEEGNTALADMDGIPLSDASLSTKGQMETVGGQPVGQEQMAKNEVLVLTDGQ